VSSITIGAHYTVRVSRDGFNALFMAFVLQSVAMNQKTAWKGGFRIVGWLGL